MCVSDTYRYGACRMYRQTQMPGGSAYNSKQTGTHQDTTGVWTIPSFRPDCVATGRAAAPRSLRLLRFRDWTVLNCC